MPKSVTLQEFKEHIEEGLPAGIHVDFEVMKSIIVLHVQPQYLTRLIFFLKDNPLCLFKQLIDICGVDYLDREKRFDVVYQFLSHKHNHRIRVKVHVAENENVPSITQIFSSAGWFEREVFDMYGVKFDGNNDLRRILTDYGFEGHPQRKDFPLNGYVEVEYDEKQKKVVYVPVKMKQKYREFDFMTPWEGTEYAEEGS